MAALVGACSTLVCSVLPATASWRGPRTVVAGFTTTTCAGGNRPTSPSR